MPRMRQPWCSGYHAPRVDPSFAARARFELAPNRLTEAVRRRRESDAPVVDLTESNPTAVGLLAPFDVLDAIAAPNARFYAPDPRGLGSAREAVAGDFARRGIAVAAERLILTASTSEAYAFLFKLLADPGDTVLVPRPGYPLFEYLARLESVNVSTYPLSWDGDWHLLRSSIEAAWTPRTRAVVVVNPNNPTGSYVERGERRVLEEMCVSQGAAIISDEVFWDYSLGVHPGRAPSFAMDGECLAFSLGGLSKSLALPQMKLGWIAVSGPDALRKTALERLEVIADTYLSVSTPVQVAAPALLARAEELQRPVRERLTLNLRTLRSAVTPRCCATLLEPQAGWSGILRVPATISEEERTLRLVEEEGVLVHPGFFFDFPSEAYLILSLLPPPELFSEGLSRVLRSLER